MNPQSKRILQALLTRNDPIPMPELSRIGSGKPDGFCASFTRRISDLRKAGHCIIMTETFGAGGQRHTAYQLASNALVEENIPTQN